MPYVTLGPHEESYCPACGGPMFGGERVYVYDPDGPAWCSVVCFNADEAFQELLEGERATERAEWFPPPTSGW